MIQKQSQLKRYADGETTTGTTTTGTKWWESMFSNLGGILSGTANIIGASKGNTNSTNFYNEQTNPRTNYTGLYVIIGVVGVALVAGIILLTRKKK